MNPAPTVKTIIEISIQGTKFSLSKSEAEELLEALNQALGVVHPYWPQRQEPTPIIPLPNWEEDDWRKNPFRYPSYPQVWCCGLSAFLKEEK